MLAAWFTPLLWGELLGQSHLMFNLYPWSVLRPEGYESAARAFEGDIARGLYPVLDVAADAVRAGQVPVWNPYSGGGMYLLGDWQSALAFPLTWPTLILPVEVAFGPTRIAILLVAALGTFRFARQLELGRRAAVIAGLVYMLSAPLIVFVQFPVAPAFACLPWMLLMTERMLSSGPPPNRRQTAALGAVVGLGLLGGQPEASLSASSAVAIYLAVRLMTTRLGRTRAVLGRWIGGHLLGVGIAAVAVIPFLGAYTESISRGSHADETPFVPLSAFITYLLPGVFGWGEPELAAPVLGYYAIASYVGIAAMLLCGVWLARSWRSSHAVALAAMALVALMTVFGIPPIRWIIEAVPPWSLAVQSRSLFIVALAIAIGSAAGFETLSRRALEPGKIAALIAAAVGATGLLVTILAVGRDLPAPRETEIEALALFGAMLALAAVALTLPGRARPGLAACLVALIVAVDLLPFRNFNVIRPPALASAGATDGLRALQNQPGYFRGGTVRAQGERPFFPPNFGALYEVEMVEGYDFPPPERWWRLQSEVLGSSGSTAEQLNYYPPPRTTAQLTARRMINQRHYLVPPGAPNPNPKLELTYDGADLALYSDPGALPRAYVVPEVVRAEHDDALVILAEGGIDPRREALVPPGAPAVAPRGGGYVAAETVRTELDRWRISVPAGTGGWLVIANSWVPSWEATVDGEERDLFPTNYALVGLPLQPGDREVVLSQRHDTAWAGASISLLAILVVIGLARPIADSDRRLDKPTQQGAATR